MQLAFADFGFVLVALLVLVLLFAAIQAFFRDIWRGLNPRIQDKLARAFVFSSIIAVCVFFGGFIFLVPLLDWFFSPVVGEADTWLA
ncbi:hypothetical protein MYX77_01810 [Acidobacteriia bacterium AH_259_A11_L15]|nr:hypothetical protein [Acidobacteriia bacterium AH_259_A11_L15]